jgi:hypothetical protein
LSQKIRLLVRAISQERQSERPRTRAPVVDVGPLFRQPVRVDDAAEIGEPVADDLRRIAKSARASSIGSRAICSGDFLILRSSIHPAYPFALGVTQPL